MTTEYNIYGNDGEGGPLDRDTPLANVDVLEYTAGPLAYPGDYLFAVNAFDTVSLLEEQNRDAVVRLILDDAGADITARPAAPLNLTARATADGGCRVTWSYSQASRLGTIGPGNYGVSNAPTEFRVWLTADTAPDYDDPPAATVLFSEGTYHYLADLTGLTDGVSYAVGVRAANDSAEEPNETFVLVTGDTEGPDPVENLAGVAI